MTCLIPFVGQYEIAAMIAWIFKHRILVTLSLSAVIVLLWYIAASYALSFSEKHEWFSSFIEVSFGLNLMVSVERIRNEMLSPIKRFVDKWIKRMVSQYSDSLRRSVVKNVESRFNEIYDSLDGRLNREVFWIVRVAQVFMALSIIVLLSDGFGIRYNILAMLIIPFFIYHLAVLIELGSFVYDFWCILLNERKRCLPYMK